MRLLVGTTDGIVLLNGGSPVLSLQGRSIGALSSADGTFWALADGHELLSGNGVHWEPAAQVEDRAATCVLAAPSSGVLVGTAGAHLLRLERGMLKTVEPFERAEDRAEWHTPWGEPPDLRSMCVQGDSILANVHVGGIQRSNDGGQSWRPTIDIEADVHEVRAAAMPGFAVAACATGLAVSADSGASWELRRDGLPVTYARAVAVAEDHVVLTVSSGPGGARSGVYRAPLAGGAFAPCATGLPAGYSQNIDTFCLDARDGTVAFGTREGSVFVSRDEGSSWAGLDHKLARVLCLVVTDA
jgi:photosystem II stability/assembly factor-like uncharacterized protein